MELGSKGILVAVRSLGTSMGGMRLALVCLLFAAPAAAQNTPYVVGEPVPALRLPTLDGETVDLASFRGKRVLLIEFAAW